MYKLNVDVYAKNDVMLNSIASVDKQYSIEAHDSVAGQTKHRFESVVKETIRNRWIAQCT